MTDNEHNISINGKEDFLNRQEHDEILAALESLCHAEPDEEQSWQALRARLEAQQSPLRSRWKRLWPVIAVASAAAAVALLLLLPIRQSRQEQQVASHVSQQQRISPTTQSAAKPASDATQTVANTTITAETITMDTVTSGIAQALNIVLPDESHVWLGANSKIIYPHTFQGQTREVAMSGQAYFRVHHDPTHPFIVHAGALTTRVLGTTFYINVYKAAKPYVALVEGRIAVSAQGTQTVLSPGKQTTWQDGKMTVESVDTYPYTQWAKGYFYFADASLLTIMEQLAQWYHKTVVFENEDAMNVRLHFVASHQEGLQSIVNKLNEQDGVRVELQRGEMIVR